MVYKKENNSTVARIYPKANYATFRYRMKDSFTGPNSWLNTLFVISIIILALFALAKYPAITGYLTGATETHTQEIDLEFTEDQEYTWNLAEHPDLFYLKSVKLAGYIIGDGQVKVYLSDGSKQYKVLDSDNLVGETNIITGFVSAVSSEESAEDPGVRSDPGTIDSAEESGTESAEAQPEDESTATEAPTEEPVAEIEPPVIEQEPTNESAEEVNATETINETIEQNETIEKPAEENITIQKLDFADVCIETCSMPDKALSSESYELIIQIDGNATFHLSSIKYETREIEIPVPLNATNETYAFEVDIKDAENKSVPALIQFVNPDTEEVELSDEITEEEAAEITAPAGPPGKFGAPQQQAEIKKPIDLDIPEGRYNIKVKPQNHPIKEIEFKNININENITEFINIDDVPETDELAGFVETYAIDPTNFDFTSAKVTVAAKGNALYKCKDWNFAEQTCGGEWIFSQSITPGQEYTFTLTPEDPGYGEMVQNLYDSCNTADVDTNLFTELASAGDITGTGTAYLLDHSSSTEMTIHTSGLKDNFTAFTVDAWLNEDLGDGRGWHFGIGSGALYGQTRCQSNTGYSPTNGYFVCFKGNNGGTQLVRVDSGSETQIASNSNNVATDGYYNYTMQLNSSGVFVFVNDNLWISSSDTTYSQGYTTISTGGGSVNRGKIYVNNVWYYDEITNEAPTTPNSITCDGGSCNNTFSNDVSIQCSGSTDADNDTITYVIDAYYNSSEGGVSPGSLYEDWESGSIPSDWTTYSSNGNGRIQVQTSGGACGSVYQGAYSLWMDVSSSSTNNLNELITNYDFTGASDIIIEGYTAEQDDENGAASDHSGHQNADGVYFTCDGNYWYALASLTDPSGWEYGYINVSADPDFCSEVNSNFAIKFTQYDNWPCTYDGRGFDNINISYTTSGGAGYSWTTIGNHTQGSSYNWNISGIDDQSNVDLRCKAIDLAGSNTYSDYYTGGFNLTISGAPPDTTPPGSVIGLTSPSQGQTWIYWTWTNPGDADFSEAIIYLGSVWKVNTSNNYYNATGLTPETAYTITVHTKDTTGNVNDTDVNDTASTLAETLHLENKSVTNAFGTPVSVLLQIINSTGGVVYSQTDAMHTIDVLEGNYTIVIQPTSGSITETRFFDVFIDASFELPRMDEPADGDYLNKFAIDPTGLSFTGANITIDASGELLLKCDNYTFDTQTCEDENWHTFATDINPGSSYTFVMSPGDPGFAEINGTANTDDAYFRSGTPNTNYGGNNNIRVGRGGAANIIRGIINFSLASVPDNATILSANLSLYFHNIPGSDSTGSRTHGVYRVQQSPIRDWIETQVTWNSYKTGSAWTSAGGDFAGTPTDTVTFNSSALNSWIVFDVTSDVQDFVNNKATNFGWVIKDTTENVNNIRRDYRSSNYGANPAQQPKLEVSWTFISNCTLTFNPASPQTYGTAVNASCSCTNPEASAKLWRNGIDVTAIENNIFTILAAQTHNYVCNVTETANWTAASTSANYTINKNITILNLTASPSWNETYGTSTTINCSASNNEVTPQLYVDGTPVGIPYTIVHGAGTYNYTCNATATQNYTADSTSNILTINKAPTTTQLYIDGVRANKTVTYPTLTNATAVTSNLTVALYRSGIPVANPEIATLAAGFYNYTAINAGNANFTSSSETWFLTVSKKISTCSLTFDPASPQTYNTSVKASCSCINPEDNVKLFRNGIDVTATENGTYVVLPAQTHTYVCNVSETQNYTAASNTSNYTINKAASAVNLLLDGTDGNIIVEVGSTVNETGILITGEAGIELYEQGSLVNSGASPLTNLTQYNALGIFNVTVKYPASQNYTASEETHQITVQDTTKPTISLISPADNTNISVQTQNFVFTANDNYYLVLNCTLYINAAPHDNNASTQTGTPTTLTGTSIPEGNNNWYIGCTDASSNSNQSETRALTVDLSAPNITLVRPTEGKIVGYSVTLDADITDNLVGVDSVWYEIKNSTGSIIASGNLPAPAYQDVWDSTTVSDGNYTFIVYANDTLGNQGNESANFTVDNTVPFIQILNPPNGTLLKTNFNLNSTYQNTRLNISRYNITDSLGNLEQSNENNSVNADYYAFTDAVNVGALPDDTYTITAYAKDSIGYETTEQSTFIVDKTAPAYSAVNEPADPSTYSPTANYNFNITWTDLNGVDTVVLEFGGTNYTVTKTGNVYYKTFGALAAGTYNYKWYANDTIDNKNSTGTLSFTINKAGSILILNITPSWTETYPTSTTVNCTANNAEVTPLLYVNGNPVANPYTTTHGAGIYNYTCNASATQNYTAPATVSNILTINQNTSTCSLIFDPLSPQTYGTAINASCSCTNPEANARVYRNGVDVTFSENNLYTVLAAQVHSYICNVTSTQNYTAASASANYTINKNITILNLAASPSWNETYPTVTTVNCTASNTEVTPQLYRNGAPVSIPDIQTLGAGSYNYICNASATQNYTAPAPAANTLTIGKTASAVNLLLDGADANITVNQNQNVNITGQRIAGEGIIELYEDVLLINSGAPVITNITSYPDVGIVNITVLYPATQNYTSSSETHFVNVIDSTPPVVSLEAPANNTIDTDGNVIFEYNVIDADSGITNCSLIFDGAVDQTNNSITEGITQSFTKTGLTTDTYAWSVNCTDDSANANEGASETRNLEVDLPQGVSLSDPADQDTNRTINATYTITVTNTGLEPDNFTLSLNNIDGASTTQLNQTQINNLPNGNSANIELYVTDAATVGIYRVNITAQSALDANATDEIQIITTVYGILSAYVTEPAGAPKYYEGQDITFKGYVYDEFASPINGVTVTFEPINDSYIYLCSNVTGEGGGIYSCTLDTTSMMAPRPYSVRINATDTYYHPGSYTNTSVFFLESGQRANLHLYKIPSVQSISSSQIIYNISLYLTNGRGTSANSTISDPDANQTWNKGTIYAAQTATESYILTYNRGATDQLITLQKANATGYDPLYNQSIHAESNQPVIVIPENESLKQLTLTKNIIAVNQTTTTITYRIIDEVVNSGDEDLTGIAVVDSDISLNTVIDLGEGESWSANGTKVINKNSQSYIYNFTKTSGFIGGKFYYSNQLSIRIPGYGGPYDVVIVTLPGSVTASNSITGSVQVINQNTEISEDRTLTTWIQDAGGTIYDLDIRTIFVGRNQSATFSVTLTAPATAGTYYFVSELVWPTATANATKSFTVTSAVPPAPGGGGGVPFEIVCGDGTCNVPELEGGEYECLEDCGYDCDNDSIKESWVPCEIIPLVEKEVPQDIIDSLIALRTDYTKLVNCETELLQIIRAAEQAAATGNYDEARNLISNARVLLASDKCIIVREIFIPGRVSYTFLGIVIFVMISLLAVLYYRKREEEIANFLREERETLTALEKKIDKRLEGHKE